MTLRSMVSHRRCFQAVFVLLACAGCQPLAGVLGGGVGHVIEATDHAGVRETLARPLGETRTATLASLKRLGIDVVSMSRTDEGEHIAGKARKDPVEVRLTPITDKATRMEVKVGEGLFDHDRATAEEVIEQTQRALGIAPG